MISKKRYIIIIFFLLVVIISTNAYDYEFYFCDEEGQPINNVQIMGWRCDPKEPEVGECLNVDRNYQITKYSQPISSGDGNYIKLEFAIPEDQGDRYRYYIYAPGYTAWTQRASLDPSIPGVATYSCGDYVSTLFKKDNCNATFVPSITSCAEAGLPLSILTDTNLSADTASTFIYDYYWPPELVEWNSVLTRMTVDIKKQGGFSSVIDFPTYSEHQIIGNTKYNFNFLWHTSQDTAPGDYEVTMTSTVPDAKCDQSNMVPVTKTFSVHIAPSLDGCVAQLQNFQSSSNPDINTEMTFSGTHVNTYQNWSYESISACNVENPELTDGRRFDTSYTLTIEKNSQVVATSTGTLQKNDDYNTPKAFSIPWTPTEYGEYEASLTITSTGNTEVCEPGTTTASATTTFEVGYDNDGDGYYPPEDCDDDNFDIKPGAPEECDGIDNNCDGTPDEICGCVEGTEKPCSELYKGICAIGTATCVNEKWTDCPTPETEICTETGDEDCDGKVDCDDNDCINLKQNNMYICQDKCVDGYYDIDPEKPGCEYKCTPTNNSKEVCDGLDNDCNGDIDEGLAETYYLDFDGDGYGSNTKKIACEKPTAYVTETGDCNDKEPNVYPGAEEICDGLDNNCDTNIDEGCSCSEGEPFTCSDKGVCDGHITFCGNDGIIPKCNFSNIPDYEKVETTCDGLDNDCDGLIDADDGLSNCCIPPATKSCTKTCLNGEQKQGTRTCENYMWSECNANCPHQTDSIKIITPESKTYYTDDKKQLAIKYTPDISCIYILNEVTSANSIRSGYQLYLEPNAYKLILQCGDTTEDVTFEVKYQKKKEIPTETDNEDLIKFFQDKLNKSQRDAAEKTKFEQSVEFAYEEDKTIINNRIETDADSLDYYLELPKCLAEHIDQVEFELPEGYEIIEEDPLVVWHFADVNDRVDLSYEVKGQISPDCLAQIRGMPIGKYLKIKKDETDILTQLFAPLTVIFIVAIIVIYIQRTHHTHLLTEVDYEHLFIEKERKKLVKSVRKMKFKSKQQAQSYMKELGLPQEERDWVLDRL